MRRHPGVTGLIERFIEGVFAAHGTISLGIIQLSYQPHTDAAKELDLPEQNRRNIRKFHRGTNRGRFTGDSLMVADRAVMPPTRFRL
jgi:hypothetical protein